MAVLLELAQQILPLLPFLWAPAAEVGSQLLMAVQPAQLLEQLHRRLGAELYQFPRHVFCVVLNFVFHVIPHSILEDFPSHYTWIPLYNQVDFWNLYITFYVGWGATWRNTTLGDNLRRLRKAAGLTQAMAVAQLQLLGFDISREILSQTENGRYNVPVSLLKALKQIYKVPSYDDFFQGI